MKRKGNLKPLPNPKFEAERCSVYIGRQRLGRFVRVSKRRWKAFNDGGRILGSFKSRARALSAIDRGAP